MNGKEASKCLRLLTEKLGVHFVFSYRADVVWPAGQVPDMTSLDRKYGTWSMRVLDKEPDIGNIQEDGLAEDMFPEDNTFGGNAYSSWYCTDGDSYMGKGFHVKYRSGDCTVKLTSRLSGRTFVSAGKRVSIPAFSSYEELKLKLEACHG